MGILKDNWFAVPHSIFSYKLSTSALILYVALLKLANSYNRMMFFRTDEYLCKLTGLSRPTISKARSELAEKKLINYNPGYRKSGKKMATEYLLKNPHHVKNFDMTM